MKRLIRPLLPLLAFASLCSLPVSAKDFEGKIVMESHHGKKVSTSTFFLKSGCLRTETPDEKKGQVFAVIMRPADKKMIILMPEQKQYMVQAFDPTKAAAKVQQMTGTTVGAIEKTGRTEKICGYECQEYQTKVNTDTVGTWVVEGFGFFASPGARGPGGGKPADWEVALREKGAFALRTVILDAKGKEKSRTEATSVEKQSLSDDLFQPPAGWTEFKMPNIPGLKGILGGE
jgi:hypothetical protein